jgi:hypothetical protein
MEVMNRIKILLASMALLAGLIACTADKGGEPGQDTPAAQEAKVEKSSVLAVQIIDSGISEFSAVANKPLPDLTLTGEDKTFQVNNCQDFISSISKVSVTVEETTYNMHTYADYQPCMASWMLSRAQASKKSHFEDQFANLIIAQLDLSSFPSSLGPRLEDSKQTLQAFNFKDTATTDRSVIVNDNGWTYEFTLLARGDFNADGAEDLLIRLLDQAGEASYFSMQTFILERSGSDAKITARNVINVLKNQNR